MNTALMALCLVSVAGTTSMEGQAAQTSTPTPAPSASSQTGTPTGSTRVHGRTAAGETIVLQGPGRPLLRPGDAFASGFAPETAYLFDKQGHAL